MPIGIIYPLVHTPLASLHMARSGRWLDRAIFTEGRRRKKMRGQVGKGVGKRATRRTLVAVLVAILIAGTVAAALYVSSKVTQDITPSGGLSLSGSFGTGYIIGTPK